MILVTDYTSYAEIRAVIGVDALELPDATLGLQTFATALYRTLLSITNSSGETLVALFDAIDPFDMDMSEEILYYTIKEYATYVVADACCSGLSMFALKSDSDGKATQSRFSSEATFKDVVKNVQQRLASLTGALDQMLGGTTTYSIPGLIRVSPATDVVTDA
jgi:hypothetical protein